MTSGTTDPQYSKTEILAMLYEYLKQACTAQTKAIAAFKDANDRVKQKLEKNGITLSEFVDYSNMRETF